MYFLSYEVQRLWKQSSATAPRHRLMFMPIPTTLTTHRILFWKATSKPHRVLSFRSLTFTLKPRAMLQFNRAQRTRLSQDVLVSLLIFKASWKNPHHQPRVHQPSRANPLTWHSSKAMLKKNKITCENTKPPSFSARRLLYTWASSTANGLYPLFTRSLGPGRTGPQPPALGALSFQSLGMGSQCDF